MDEHSYREAMAQLATGVTVVTASAPSLGLAGMTANAVTSVSLHPPLLLVSLEEGTRTLAAVLAGGRFCVNVLSARQGQLARRFALRGLKDRFGGVAYHLGQLGMPVLEGTLAHLECTVWRHYPAQDHRLVLGEAQAGGVGDGDALVFLRHQWWRAVPRQCARTPTLAEDLPSPSREG